MPSDLDLKIRISAEIKNLNRTLQSVRGELAGLTGGAKRAGTETARGMQDVARGANSAKDAVRELGQQMAAALSVAVVVRFSRAAIREFAVAEAGFRGLEAVANHSGEGIGRAMQAAAKLSADGLVSMQDTSKALQNLLSRGYRMEDAVQVLERLKDAAAFNRQASLSMSEAVVSATEGLKNENSVLVDNAGVTKNVAKMWEEYAAQLGKSAQQLTQAEKIQAEVNGILRETEAQAGNAAKAAGGMQGEMARLDTEARNLKVSIGQALAPAFSGLLSAGTAVINQFMKPLVFLFQGAGVRAGQLAQDLSVLWDVMTFKLSRDDGIKAMRENARVAEEMLEEMAAQLSGAQINAQVGLGATAGYDPNRIAARQGELAGGGDGASVDKFLERYRTDQERLNDEIATFRELAAKANLAEADVLAGIERIKAAFAKKDKTKTDDDGLREIERLVAQLETERDTLGLTEEQVRAYNIEKLRSKAAGDVAAQAALDTAVALNQEVAALEAAEETRRRLDDAKRRIMDEVDPNAPLLRELELIEELKAAYPEYAAAFDEAALRIHERMDELGETSETTGDSMTEMAVQAARNIQSSFADFLFDPFKDGMNGMLSSFVTTIRRMLSELLAAQALRAFFNSMSGLGGGVGSLFGSLAANIKHTGGLAGTGPTRSIPALAFIGAPRYHSGGLAGDEVPAILQRGEEVLTRDDPRHQANGGGSSQGVRIVNVIDPAMTRDYLTSSEGERTILNVLAANQGAVRQILA